MGCFQLEDIEAHGASFRAPCRELLPRNELLAFLVNPEYPDIETQVKDVGTATGALG